MNAMHDFQKSSASNAVVCMILRPFQGSKSCIASKKVQKIMHTAANVAEVRRKSCIPPHLMQLIPIVNPLRILRYRKGRNKNGENPYTFWVPAVSQTESVGFEFRHDSENVDFIRVQGIVQFAVFSSVFIVLRDTLPYAKDRIFSSPFPDHAFLHR